MAIDTHCHWFPEPFLDLLEREGAPYDVLVRRENGRRRLIFKGAPHPPLDAFRDVTERLCRMDRRGIRMQVLSLSAQVHVSWGDGALALALAQIVNDEYARLAAEHPARFAGIAALPLHEPRRALEELERAVRVKGLRGAGFISNVEGVYLDDQRFWPLYEAAQALGVPIVIHPAGPAGRDKMREYELVNFVGFPLDTTLTAARMIFGGVLERFPRLRVLLYHGGGQIPYILGRWDHGYQARPAARAAIPRPPSAYLPAFAFDTIVHAPGALAFLVATVGAGRVVVGTDYPYDMADDDPVGSVRAAPGLGQADRDRILHGNAAALFGLPNP